MHALGRGREDLGRFSVADEAAASRVPRLHHALVDAHACLLFHGASCIWFVPASLTPSTPRAHGPRTSGSTVLIDVRADAAVPVLLDWGMHQHLEDPPRLGIAGIADAVARGAGDELPALYASLGVKLSEHVPASMILHFWKFVLRPGDDGPRQGRGRSKVFSRATATASELQDALEKAGGNQGPIATGLGPLLGTVRSLGTPRGGRARCWHSRCRSTSEARHLRAAGARGRRRLVGGARRQRRVVRRCVCYGYKRCTIASALHPLAKSPGPAPVISV